MIGWIRNEIICIRIFFRIKKITTEYNAILLQVSRLRELVGTLGEISLDIQSGVANAEKQCKDCIRRFIIPTARQFYDRKNLTNYINELWTQYAVSYLGEDSTFSHSLSVAGRFCFAAVIMITVVNFFTPILFWFDESGTYHAGPLRDVQLVIQIILLILTSVYALKVIPHSKGAIKKRYQTIGERDLHHVLEYNMPMW